MLRHDRSSGPLLNQQDHLSTYGHVKERHFPTKSTLDQRRWSIESMRRRPIFEDLENEGFLKILGRPSSSAF